MLAECLDEHTGTQHMLFVGWWRLTVNKNVVVIMKILNFWLCRNLSQYHLLWRVDYILVETASRPCNILRFVRVQSPILVINISQWDNAFKKISSSQNSETSFHQLCILVRQWRLFRLCQLQTHINTDFHAHKNVPNVKTLLTVA